MWYFLIWLTFVFKEKFVFCYLLTRYPCFSTEENNKNNLTNENSWTKTPYKYTFLPYGMPLSPHTSNHHPPHQSTTILYKRTKHWQFHTAYSLLRNYIELLKYFNWHQLLRFAAEVNVITSKIAVTQVFTHRHFLSLMLW